MSKFSVAVRTGLNSAETAKRNKQEIKDILKSLSESVEAATEGKVRVRLLTGIDAVAEGAWQAFASFLLAKKNFDLIVVEGATSQKSRKIEIARFQHSTTGFPCTVSVSSDEYICINGESLENVLSKIFQSTEVGMAIIELQNSASISVDRISQSTGVKDQRTVIGQITLVSPPGKIVEEPFASRVIREVSAKPTSRGAGAVLAGKKVTSKTAPKKSDILTTVQKTAVKPSTKKVRAVATIKRGTAKPTKKGVIAI